MKKMTKKQLDLLVTTRYDDLLSTFPGYKRSTLRRMRREEKERRETNQPSVPVEAQVEMDGKFKKEKDKKRTVDKKYKHLLDENELLKKEKKAILRIKEPVQPFKITPLHDTESEATAFMIASDWHFEEVVKVETVSELNEFNKEVAHYRAKKFFQNGLRLYNMSRKEIEIKTIVLALLGDFISGNIHEELLENNRLEPMDAIIEVQRVIISGINHLLEMTDAQLVIPCHSGNHPRITRMVHHSTEAGNSLEYFMYCNLVEVYKDNPRVIIIPARGYHSYLNVYDVIVRFHHGHAIKYGGGVGGITVPVNKAIAQWNKARHADYDVFGHYHQRKDLGNWMCNGSLIGYNAFALKIKADYELPQQAFFLIDKKRGKTIVAPILLNGH